MTCHHVLACIRDTCHMCVWAHVHVCARVGACVISGLNIY